MTRTASRHDRVWLAAATWREGLRSSLDATDAAEVDDWVHRGRALVTRRRDPASAADACCVGVALPLASGRRRIGLVVGRPTVIRVAAPLGLDEVVAAAPSDRHAALDDLRRRVAALDTPLAVYGSYAWQTISGEPCVTPTSDLDLLWDARDDDQVTRMVDVLLAWERDRGLRADGEVRFGNGDAVAWRELATNASHVIVKRDDGVALKPRPLVR